MTLAVISCVYADYVRFIPAWAEAMGKLRPAPDQVIVLTDSLSVALAFRSGDYGRHVSVIVSPCTWKHPQAFYLNEAVKWTTADWVWQVDIDDIPHPDALAGLEDVDADVWQMGFDRSDGERYVPPTLTNDEYLALDSNPYVGTSAIRVEAFWSAGGFQDVALQDWALWRRLAKAGATFQSSGRTHFRYERHPATRGATELTMGNRAEHLAEMYESESLAVL